MTEESTTRSCSCHCGAVQFTGRLPATLTGMRCNCSICAAKGAIMVGLPLDALEVTAEKDQLGCYEFNTRTAKHYFCKTCGIHCFHQRRDDPGQFAINATCIHGVDIYNDFADLPVNDGINHARDSGVRRMAGWLHYEPAA
ncbi:MAG: hypothetical protein RLZZ08_1975 [Pseudomonadota bacterium]